MANAPFYAPPAVPSEQIETVLGRSFSEREYLEMNPDVRAGVASGQFSSGRDHFEKFGHAEGRLGRRPEQSEGFFAEQSVDLGAVPTFRAEHFPYAGPHPWLDRPEWESLLAQKQSRGEISDADAELCRHWAQHGYIILKGCVEPAVLDTAWAAYEAAVATGRINLRVDKINADDPWPGRYLDPHLKVPEFCAAMRHAEILRWVKLLMEREPAPFQSIASHKGTQQSEHSDSIHMTTYPLGYMTAAWIAFEDIDPASGPLVYYPGSHRLPYVFSKDVGITPQDFLEREYHSYAEKYEPYIKELLRQNQCEPSLSFAKKGDVLLWHANLIHGGSPRTDVRLSRRALVCHYFVKGAVTYHDLAASPARPHLGTCLLRKQED
jgi:hypothetical protein